MWLYLLTNRQGKPTPQKTVSNLTYTILKVSNLMYNKIVSKVLTIAPKSSIIIVSKETNVKNDTFDT